MPPPMSMAPVPPPRPPVLPVTCTLPVTPPGMLSPIELSPVTDMVLPWIRLPCSRLSMEMP